MPMDPQKVEELRDSAEKLAKQALETAEMGVRLVRTELEGFMRAPSFQPGDVQKNIQDVTLQAETKAKDVFSLATQFMLELNDKWQPGQKPTPTAQSTPEPEKITIDFDK